MEISNVYKSKIDFLLILIIVSAGIVLAVAATNQYITEGISHPATWILLLSSIFYIAIILTFAYPVSYEISPPDLLIRSGLTKSRITLSSIEVVQPTRNPASSPALSLDRLKIDYKKQGKLAFTLISPEDKNAFMNELVQKTEGLQLREEGIIRFSESKCI
ncbi:MAG: PH domain-containing protein [candidate division Zixibacteria bacterium]|nr:PH domain-containing protein [candidate division Zixibacteria bacterium]